MAAIVPGRAGHQPRQPENRQAAQSRLSLERKGTVQDMIFEQLLEQALFTAYRVGGYALLHLMDDPALLAIVFC